MKKLVLRLGFICYGVSMLVIVGGALLLHRGADVSRLETLLMALIFFSVAGYVLAGPPWPRRRKNVRCWSSKGPHQGVEKIRSY